MEMKEYDRNKSRETSACATDSDRLSNERENRYELLKTKNNSLEIQSDAQGLESSEKSITHAISLEETLKELDEQESKAEFK